jgi:hypothetical protein
MAGKTDIPVVLSFHGAPDDMEGIVQIPFNQVVSEPLLLELKAPTVEAPITLQAEAAGPSLTWLRLELPEATPPGTYQGTVNIASRKYQSIVDVMPHTNFLLIPDQLSLNVNPGDRATVRLTASHGFGLFDLEGAEKGIRTALTSTSVKGQERFNQLIEGVARGHGGLVRLVVRDGAGLIGPDESRTLLLELSIPKQLNPGHIYEGTWPLANLNYYIYIKVLTSNKAPSKEDIK